MIPGGVTPNSDVTGPLLTVGRQHFRDTIAFAMDLREELRSIASKDDLARFVDLLHKDLQTNPDSWGNATLDHFLEAMHAWLLDSARLHQKTAGGDPESPTWGTFAEILSAARIYE